MITHVSLIFNRRRCVTVKSYSSHHPRWFKKKIFSLRFIFLFSLSPSIYFYSINFCIARTIRFHSFEGREREVRPLARLLHISSICASGRWSSFSSLRSLGHNKQTLSTNTWVDRAESITATNITFVFDEKIRIFSSVAFRNFISKISERSQNV